MEQLRGIDASFIHLERNKNRFQVGTLLFYDVSTVPDQLVRFKDILATFRDRIAQNSLLRKRIQQVPFGLDDPYWVEDDNFDIEYHVRHIALPKPGDWRQLCIQVARLHSRPLDLSRPLWEVYVIEGLDNVKNIPKNGFAMYVKLHHASIDGIAGNDLIAAIHDSVPVPPPPRDVENHTPSRNRGNTLIDNLTVLRRAMGNSVKQPLRFYNLAKRLPPAFLRVRKAKEEGQFTPIGQSASTRFNGGASGHLVLDAAIFQLDDLKAVKNSMEGITINDVMLAIVSGALQKYLTAKDETPSNLAAGMPINIRPLLDNLNEQDANNLVTIAKVSLENTIEDPLQRLRAIHQSANESKAYQDALGADIMLEVSRSMPSLLINLASRSLHRVLVTEKPVVNTIITNVPGSQTPLYMGGAKLAGMCNIGIVLDGMGIFHAVSSYCGSATVSFQACRRMMPDPQFYRQCLIESFGELVEATKKPGKSSTKKVTTKSTARKARKAPTKKTPRQESVSGD